MKRIILFAFCLILLSCQQNPLNNSNKAHDPETEYPFKWTEKEIAFLYNAFYSVGIQSGFTVEQAEKYAACCSAEGIRLYHDPAPYIKTIESEGQTSILDIKIPSDYTTACLESVMSN